MYIATNFARFVACCFDARSMTLNRSCQLFFFVFLGENIERERNKISLVCQLYPSRLIGMGMGGGGGNILLKPSYVLSSAEQDCHDQRMGKSDLEAVDKAVTCALENSKVVMVSRVVQDGLHCGRH